MPGQHLTLAEAAERYQQLSGLRQRNQNDRSYLISSLLSFLGGDVVLSDLRPPDLQAWLEYQNWTEKTRYVRLAQARQFFKKFGLADLIAVPTGYNYETTVLEQKALDLLRYAPVSNNYSTARGQAMALLILAGGFGRDQLLTLVLSDYNPYLGLVSLPERLAVLNAEAKTALEHWLRLRRQRGNCYKMFTTYQGKPLPTQYCSKSVLKFSRSLGLNISIRLLRRTYFHAKR